jgi:hypothetical protein
MPGQPSRVAELAELELQGNLLAAGQGDGHIAAPPPVRGPGLGPCSGAPAGRPSLQPVLGHRVPQGLGAVLAAGWGHARWVREMLVAGTASPAPRHQGDAAGAVRQVRSGTAQGAYQRAVPVVPLGVPFVSSAVSDMHFPPRFQVQANHQQIHSATSDGRARGSQE